MSTRIMRLFGVSLTVVLMTTGFATAAHADSSTPGDVWTAPVPTKIDASGTDQDEFCVTDNGSFYHPSRGVGSYYVYGGGVAGCNKISEVGATTSNGVTSITIVAEWDSGSWTYDFSDQVTGAEAENSYSVTVGDECYESDGFAQYYRSVTAYFTNTADESGRYVESIYPKASDASDGSTTLATESADRILDGETRAIPIRRYDDEPGLYPGTWNVEFYKDGNTLAHSTTITVPACESTNPPPKPVSGKATGDLRKLACMKVGVTASARNFWARSFATYRIVKYLAGRKVGQRDFTVAARAVKKFTVYQPLRKPNRRAKTELRVFRGGRFVWVDSVSRCRR
jgi:hypothetical protein